ncbi:transforming growth factor-beta-induced protein ig-h3-like [Gigantopelta aegis]|uniref:transforming growth factor-beta-induced protein ig-h3-like n=1 Tax=Gigantopelta aegis TaxID=1735272 RepID=UPI001B887951|nr:transforming growth factor-beta-induced protein ig-h3-like [Gigantopelta aegis]
MGVLLLILLVGCAWGQHGTIMDVLHHRRDTSFISYIQQAGLEDTLKGAGPFTVFAPTNHAFRRLSTEIAAKMKLDPALLKSIIKYHIVSGSTLSHNDLMANEKLIPSMEGHDIRVNHYLFNQHMLVTGARIYHYSGLTATNGAVIEINDVMIPPGGSVLDLINNDPELSTLKQVVQSAGLTTFLQEQHPITLFAPTNKAFEALGGSVTQGLIQQPALLTTLLKYHVVPGSLWSDDFHQQMLETFDDDDKLRLHKFLFFGYDVDSAQIKTKDIAATNGVVHKIADVLVPKSIQAQVSALKVTTAPPPVVNPSDAP